MFLYTLNKRCKLVELNFRKDDIPKNTIRRIKNILERNGISYREMRFKKCGKFLYSGRIEINNSCGANGKGLTKNMAKASAYAELIERLQTGMFQKKRVGNLGLLVDRNNKYISTVLKKAPKTYCDQFFRLDDYYFIIDKMINIKNNREVELPIRIINAVCHTNGLAAGNSKEEAITQAICEILERFSYKKLLNDVNMKSFSIIGYEKQLSPQVHKVLKWLQNQGFKYDIKDCSLHKYPVVGFVLYNKDKTRYCYSIGADPNFNIALSRAITEMFQGQNKKSLLRKMKNIELNPNKLNLKYKKHYKSFNWLMCFNYNNGLVSPNMLETRTIDVGKLKFNNNITNNIDALNYLTGIIKEDIYIKEYNDLGFCSVRVYIPSLSEIDNFDKEDLLISKQFFELRNTYCDILHSSRYNINCFVNVLLKICKCIKYNNLIYPKDIFKVKAISDYYKLSFTSLLIVLALLCERKVDLIKLLQYQIDNFPLNNELKVYYQALILLLNNNNSIDVDKGIKSSFRKLIDDPYHYLKSLNPKLNKEEIPLYNKLN